MLTIYDQISYAQIMTRYDSTINPINSSELNGAANTYTQDICVNNRANPLYITVVNQTAYLIVTDALKHDGSALVT